MKGTNAIYLGRIVDKTHFRAFIYGENDARRLVESWEEFEANMQSGVWFATIEEATAIKKIVEKTRAKQKPRRMSQVTPIEVDEVDDVLPDDGTVFAVTDDFLPNERK